MVGSASNCCQGEEKKWKSRVWRPNCSQSGQSCEVKFPYALTESNRYLQIVVMLRGLRERGLVDVMSWESNAASLQALVSFTLETRWKECWGTFVIDYLRRATCVEYQSSAVSCDAHKLLRAASFMLYIKMDYESDSSEMWVAFFVWLTIWLNVDHQTIA